MERDIHKLSEFLERELKLGLAEQRAWREMKLAERDVKPESVPVVKKKVG